MHLYSIFSRISIIIALFLLFTWSASAGIFELCPMMKGTTFTNTTRLWDEPMLVDKVTKRLASSRSFCKVGDQSSTRVKDIMLRSTCYTVFDEEYGIEQVEPEYYFPMLSYKRKIHISDQISTRFLQASEDPRKARVAYIILAHSNLPAVKRLIGSIYDTNNVYLIHVDAKADQLKSDLMTYTTDFDNVAVMPTSFNISWGSIDMVYATLEALFTLLDAAKFDHVINLSAADYPICTQEEVGRFLKQHPQTNFDFAYWASELHIQYRLQNVFLWDDKSKTCQLPDIVVNIPHQMDHIWSTSQWFAYNYDFVKYLRENPLSHRILAWLETSLIPDESYFGNVLMNSPFAEARDRNNLHYAAFTKNSLHPDTQTVADFSHLAKNQENICFARKFDAREDPDIMDMLDDWRAQKKSDEFIEHFWQPRKW